MHVCGTPCMYKLNVHWRECDTCTVYASRLYSVRVWNACRSMCHVSARESNVHIWYVWRVCVMHACVTHVYTCLMHARLQHDRWQWLCIVDRALAALGFHLRPDRVLMLCAARKAARGTRHVRAQHARLPQRSAYLPWWKRNLIPCMRYWHHHDATWRRNSSCAGASMFSLRLSRNML